MRGHHRYNIKANKKEQSSWVNFGVNLVFWFRLLLFGSAFVLMLCFALLFPVSCLSRFVYALRLRAKSSLLPSVSIKPPVLSGLCADYAPSTTLALLSTIGSRLS